MEQSKSCTKVSKPGFSEQQCILSASFTSERPENRIVQLREVAIWKENFHSEIMFRYKYSLECSGQNIYSRLFIFYHSLFCYIFLIILLFKLL